MKRWIMAMFIFSAVNLFGYQPEQRLSMSLPRQSRKIHKYSPKTLKIRPRILKVEATAYTLDQGSGTGRTSIGTIPREGVTVAVDPRLIPYGSRVFIPGYGFRIAEDSGGAIKGRRIDLYFRRDRDALKFGRKEFIISVYLGNQQR